MFDFLYNGTVYKAKYWIESNPNNFLIMAEDLNKDVKFIYSKNIKSLPTTVSFLRSASVDISKNELYNIRKVEKEEYDLIDYQNVNLAKVDFISLLNIYRRLNFINVEEVIKLKEKIFLQMEKTLFEYKEKGRFDFSDDILDLLNFSFSITSFSDNVSKIKDLVDEFLLFIRIKIYLKLNLYDLLCERKKFDEILKGDKTLEEFGYDNIDIYTLSDRLVPAVDVLIRLKEDLILTELFNVTRKAILLNPFTVTKKQYDLTEKDDFKYQDEARFNYNYMYYEDLGINTDIVKEEIRSYNKWEYEKISSHIYEIAKDTLNKIDVYSENFLKTYRYSIALYGEFEYIRYLMNFIFKAIM